MSIASAQPSRTTSRPWAPPLPREHGAWVMLFAPMLVPLLAGPSFRLLPVLLLVSAATIGFLLQHVAGLLLRGRSRPQDRIWFACLLGLLILCSLPLVLVFRFTALLPLALLAGGMFGVQAGLWHFFPRQRFERSLWGELLAAAVLTLTGPAAWVITRGSLEGMAWRLWAWFVLFFISGILFINMLLAAARHRSSPDLRARWHLGRGHLVYHALLVVIIGALAIRMSAGAAFLFVLAWIPMFLRAIKGWITFSHRPPSLKRVGMGELLYALWFTALLSAWLRVG